jgi:peptidoglycan hydrolase-like protein with peptidoglycan-binding domain
LNRDIQTKLKALNCYTGRIDGDWGRGTRAGVERFNKIADRDLNVDAAEPETLDALATWSGEDCPAKTIVRQKSPAPKAAQPKTRTRPKPTYTQKKPAYQQKKQATQPNSHDIETDTVHRLMRPNLH